MGGRELRWAGGGWNGWEGAVVGRRGWDGWEGARVGGRG